MPVGTRVPKTSNGCSAIGRPESRARVAKYSSRMKGKAIAAASTAATAAPIRNGTRRRGSAKIRSAQPIGTATIAKVTPPIQVELSKPAATTNARAATTRGVPRRARRHSSRTAATAQVAEARCCGAQLAWTSQVCSSESGGSSAFRPCGPSTAVSTGRSEPARLRSSTQSAALRRPLNHTARPIISTSEAKAVHPVRAMSASQPLTCSSTARRAALKCQR